MFLSSDLKDPPVNAGLEIRADIPSEILRSAPDSASCRESAKLVLRIVAFKSFAFSVLPLNKTKISNRIFIVYSFIKFLLQLKDTKRES